MTKRSWQSVLGYWPWAGHPRDSRAVKKGALRSPGLSAPAAAWPGERWHF